MSCENGIPYGTGPSRDEMGAIKAKTKYTPTKVSNEVSERAEEIIEFFMEKGVVAEFALAVAGVWGCESGINGERYNQGEHDNGGRARGKHAPDCKTFKYGGNTYYYSEEVMKTFGYGKGLAQWTWDRPLKFRDWYNSAESVKTEGLSTMDENAAEITATSVSTQTAFAWKEMNERTGEFMSTVRGLQHAAGGTDAFKENVKLAVDAVTRGFENGSNKSFAPISFMDKYSGDYWGVDFKKRYEYALGVYEKLKDNSKYRAYFS